MAATKHEDKLIMGTTTIFSISSQRRVWAFVLLTTTVLIIASLLITGATITLLGTTDVELTYSIAFIVPLLTTPPTIYLFAQAVYQLQQAQHKLTQLAYTDELTALANRRHFFAQGNHLLTTAQTTAQTTALLLLDVNNFKPINDAWGHAAGDDALRLIAHVLRNFAEPGDLIARLGGDEFALLRPNATRKEMVKLSVQLRQQLIQTPYEHNDAVLPMTISTGASDTTQATTIEALLHISDMALYAAKVEHYRQTNRTNYSCRFCPVA